MLVRDLMNTHPGKISPEASLGEALRQMAELKNRHLVVLEDDGSVIGILSDRDLALYYHPQGMTAEQWENVRVRELMTKEPITVGSTAEIGEAARLLLKMAISALPVVDSGSLIGILSDRDFTRYFSHKK